MSAAIGMARYGLLLRIFQWSADSHFTVPYVKWGMKNLSTFVLRVDQSVEIEIHASGEVPSGLPRHCQSSGAKYVLGCVSICQHFCSYDAR